MLLKNNINISFMHDKENVANVLESRINWGLYNKIENPKIETPSGHEYAYLLFRVLFN